MCRGFNLTEIRRVIYRDTIFRRADFISIEFGRRAGGRADIKELGLDGAARFVFSPPHLHPGNEQQICGHNLGLHISIQCERDRVARRRFFRTICP
jgi:hypothetical protein